MFLGAFRGFQACSRPVFVPVFAGRGEFCLLLRLFQVDPSSGTT
jgi:hypothetical protein